MKTRIRLLSGGAVLVTAAALAAFRTQTARCEGQQVSPPAQASTATRQAIGPKRVSFYEVPLVCPAAPKIGCGSASKPILLALENSPAVSEAWLNRAGTIMALVWSEQSKAGEHSDELKSVLEARDITARELTGASRRAALKDFRVSSGWYRGAEVDRLSEEEAGIIAAKWVGRVREKVPLTDAKAQALQQGFTGAVKLKVTGQATRIETQEAMLKTCREHLDERDVAILLDTFKAELAPTSGQ